MMKLIQSIWVLACQQLVVHINRNVLIQQLTLHTGDQPTTKKGEINERKRHTHWATNVWYLNSAESSYFSFVTVGMPNLQRPSQSLVWISLPNGGREISPVSRKIWCNFQFSACLSGPMSNDNKQNVLINHFLQSVIRITRVYKWLDLDFQENKRFLYTFLVHHLSSLFCYILRRLVTQFLPRHVIAGSGRNEKPVLRNKKPKTSDR